MLHIKFPIEKETNHSLVWLTDLHIDACKATDIDNFLSQLNKVPARTLLVGGDICNGPNAFKWLTHLQTVTKKEVYFVLGNHDYYNNSISDTRESVNSFNREQELCHYLSGNGSVALSSKTALVGHDGWADGRIGDFLNSSITLNDYCCIEELKGVRGNNLLNVLKKLGTESADQAKKNLLEALINYDNVIFLTHVPPFKEACVYQGKVTDDNWGPHFVCGAMGDALLEVVEKYPNKQILCLCGHSHSEADVVVQPNLRVISGAATIGNPTIQGIINFE